MSKAPEPMPAPVAAPIDDDVLVACVVKADVAWRAPVIPGRCFNPPEEGSRIMRPKERARVPRELARSMEDNEHVLIIEDK